MFLCMGVGLNCCSQNGANSLRGLHYDVNHNVGTRLRTNIGQSSYMYMYVYMVHIYIYTYSHPGVDRI